MMKNIQAVLTADVVNSSLLSTQARKDLTDKIKAEFDKLKAPSDFYRGDSFHAMLKPAEALLQTCKWRAFAKSILQSDEQEVDIRIAIGLGSVNEPVTDMATAQGEAFDLSGRELDAMGKSGVRLSIRCADVKAELGFKAVAAFTDFILTNLTYKQAEALVHLLDGATETEAAVKLEKSQPTVNKLKRAAHWEQLDQMLDVYAKLVALL
jgi:hypothetical protein